ncbi:MAG TPA: HAD-IIIC family phosphatase [Candidatus Acidoferrum sp.]|nr:HAD-IIIC family phosphatase [Candidatus Acidoferrum sp.]
MSNKTYTNLEWLAKPATDFTQRCKNLLEVADGVGREVQSLATCALDQNQLTRLAGSIEKLRAKGADLKPLVPFRLGLLSNSTTDFIIPALVATAARHGISLEVVAGGYDQVLQEALTPESLVNRSAPDAVLLAVDYRSIPTGDVGGDSKKAADAVNASQAYLQAVREGLRRNSNAVCLFQTFSAPPETLFGNMDGAYPGSLQKIIDGINVGMTESIRGFADIVIDVAHLASTVGLADWHSPREWNFAKLPFAAAFIPLYADHVCRAIAALRGKSRKCLVLDLDNTLWGGIIGDDGLEGIKVGSGDPIGEAHLRVQQLALDLRARGVVLAVCSKNEDDIARMPFRRHPDMLLKEHHIAVFQANWKDKATNIKAIAQELSLGLDSMVLLDDSPFERLLVRQILPEVAVPELPEDPALYARTLAAAGYFETVTLSQDDLRRAEFYQENARRVSLQQEAGDLESYLKSLSMEITFQPFDETGRARIAQLINKSNQFNLTTRRYTEAQVAAIQKDPAYFTLQVRLSDIVGDNGMISVVICRRKTKEEWEIDTWLMSCRVLGRRVENMVLLAVLEQAKKEGVRKLVGSYISTDRNKLVEGHYPKLGFRLVKTENNVATYEIDVESAVVEGAPMLVKHVSVAEVETEGNGSNVDVLPLAEASVSSSVKPEPISGTEPLNETESTLVGIWENLLERENISVHDDFFELGGDSLLGIRLMIEIENTFHRQFDISTLASSPTIQSLARELTPSKEFVHAVHIVPMRPQGDRTPLICIHCGTGHVLRYRALASFLDSDIPIYGLRAPDLRAMKTVPTVEDLAALYVEDIRKIQPRGPYHLFGFCVGGTVAFEVARQLTEIGEAVSPVVMVEALNAAYYLNAPLLRSFQHHSRYVYGRVSKYGGRFLRGEWKDIYAGVRDLISWQEKKRRASSPRTAPELAETRSVEDIYEDIAMLSTIANAYEPKPFSGKIHLIRAETQKAEYAKDLTFGWEDIAQGGVQVRTLPGDHFSLLERPNVGRVADTLGAWLAEAESLVKSES